MFNLRRYLNYWFVSPDKRATISRFALEIEPQSEHVVTSYAFYAVISW